MRVTRFQPPSVRALLAELAPEDVGQRYLYRTAQDGSLRIAGERHRPVLTVKCAHCLGVFEEPLGEMQACPYCHRFERGAA